jgi:hypothetical protein
VAESREKIGYFRFFALADPPAKLDHAGAEQGHQQMGGNLAEQRNDGDSHQYDQQEQRAADPHPWIDQEHGPALAQPVEAGAGIDLAALTGKRAGAIGKAGVSFMRGC